MSTILSSSSSWRRPRTSMASIRKDPSPSPALSTTFALFKALFTMTTTTTTTFPSPVLGILLIPIADIDEKTKPTLLFSFSFSFFVSLFSDTHNPIPIHVFPLIPGFRFSSVNTFKYIVTVKIEWCIIYEPFFSLNHDDWFLFLLVL